MATLNCITDFSATQNGQHSLPDLHQYVNVTKLQNQTGKSDVTTSTVANNDQIVTTESQSRNEHVVSPGTLNGHVTTDTFNGQNLQLIQSQETALKTQSYSDLCLSDSYTYSSDSEEHTHSGDESSKDAPHQNTAQDEVK